MAKAMNKYQNKEWSCW